jgi:hypothetical protein
MGSVTVAFCVIGLASAPAGEPTDYEQYMLELVNRARLNPVAEGLLHGVDLNDPGTGSPALSPEPKQPLAFSSTLIDMAREHAQYCANRGGLTHVRDDGSVGPPFEASGYNMQWSLSSGENIAWAPRYADLSDSVDLAHRALWRDSSTPNRAHRRVMLDSHVREAGLGIRFGVWSGRPVMVATEDVIGTWQETGVMNILTGVVYDDGQVKDDDFYTPGEGLGNVEVVATALPNGPTYRAVTYASGGYKLLIPPEPATYRISASGPGLGTVVWNGELVVTGLMLNQKIDFTPQGAVYNLSGDAGAEVRVTVNGQSGSAAFDEGTWLTIEGSIQGGLETGAAADWWCLAEVGGALYTCDFSSMEWNPGLAVADQDSVPSSYAGTLFEGDHLRPGSYKLHFGIDRNQNGLLDFGALVKDSVQFTIR